MSAAAFLVVLGCETPGPPPEIAHVDGKIHLALKAPLADQELSVAVPWLEVRGSVSGGELAGADVILALDLSNSALHASGYDVDGDGDIGENRYEIRDGDKWNRPYKIWVTDPDDSIARAELAAAETLVRALEPTGARFALITYHSRAYVKAELGPAADTLEAIGKIRLQVDKTGSRLTEPLRKAEWMLKRSRREGPNQPPPAVVLFTDGLPTTISQRSRDLVRFRALAEDLSEFGTRVYVLGFGEDAPEDDEIAPILASLTGGHHLHVNGDPSRLEVLTGPSNWDLLDLSIENLSGSEPARALRSFPDGSFDAFLKLREGENQVRVRLHDNHGRSLSETHRVIYRAPASASEEQLLEGEAILARLSERLREIELASSRKRPSRTVTVSPDEDADENASSETP